MVRITRSCWIKQFRWISRSFDRRLEERVEEAEHRPREELDLGVVAQLLRMMLSEWLLEDRLSTSIVRWACPYKNGIKIRLSTLADVSTWETCRRLRLGCFCTWVLVRLRHGY
jgi:hypothetical protein